MSANVRKKKRKKERNRNPNLGAGGGEEAVGLGGVFAGKADAVDGDDEVADGQGAGRRVHNVRGGSNVRDGDERVRGDAARKGEAKRAAGAASEHDRVEAQGGPGGGPGGSHGLGLLVAGLGARRADVGARARGAAVALDVVGGDAQRAVVVPAVLAPLEEAVRGDEALKGGGGNKRVLEAGNLARARGAARDGHGEVVDSGLHALLEAR